MFNEDASDLSVGIIASSVSALLIVPIIILYLSLKNSGALAGTEGTELDHSGLLVGSIFLAVSIILLGITSGEWILDSEGLYYFLSIAGAVLWIIGSIILYNCLFYTGAEVSFIHDYEYINDADKWLVLLSCVIFAVSGFFSLIMLFKNFEWCHNGVTNLYFIAVFVVMFTLITVFMLSSLFEAVLGVLIIAFIPFVIEIVSIVVSFIRNGS